MTLLPVEMSRLGGPLADDGWGVYDLPPVCQCPGCNETWALEKHHCVPRSRTAGPRRWVSIDGIVRPNVVHLCRTHHADVTGGPGGHRAWVRWPSQDSIDAGLYSARWLWYTPDPQFPPARGSLISKTGLAWRCRGELKGAILL